jgi:hypothetical protein
MYLQFNQPLSSCWHYILTHINQIRLRISIRSNIKTNSYLSRHKVKTRISYTQYVKFLFKNLNNSQHLQIEIKQYMFGKDRPVFEVNGSIFTVSLSNSKIRRQDGCLHCRACKLFCNKEFAN